MSWPRTLLLGAIVVPLALATRWGGSGEAKGSRFHPWPDAVEYAAEAQTIARSGQVFLQIGPYRERPRFPPGWPLLIAPAIRLGMQGQDLWRLTALFGAALAWLLAGVAAWAVGPHHPGPLLPTREKREWLALDLGPLVAGLLAGCVWAIAPMAVDVGQVLMSDEPAALVCLAGLLLTGIALLRAEGRSAWAFALAGGLAFGLATTMRSIVAVLLFVPLAVFLIGGLRRSGPRTILPRVLFWTLGAAVFPAVTVLILARSGWPVWQWSGYDFWMPGRYGHLTSTFNLRYAFEPDAAFGKEVQGRPLSHLELAARVLLGIPGLRVHHYLGLLWPIAGWLAAIPLFRIARRRDPRLAGWTALALLLWTLGHVAVFSLYFYPSPRFYMEPLALCLVLLATACGVGLSRPDGRARLAAIAVVVGVGVLVAQEFAEFRREPLPAIDAERTRARFARWLAMGDERRADRVMPFDPVHAQALGLLTPKVAAQVRAWGTLPDTVHVRRLRANGVLQGAPAREGARLPVR
jgi:4-amino-4-deoxy-L-arabinose transferase-like glycosyltransferase